MPIAIISHHNCLDHEMGPYHPERPARIHNINDQLISSGMEYVCQFFDAPKADKSQLLLAHSAQHVDYIYANAPTEGTWQIDGDTSMNPKSLRAAEHSAGAGIMAVDKVMQGEFKRAFCAVRPPGHHAEYNKAMGFCLFNNIAIAAQYAIQAYGLERVAIIDFDVHHGNGTEDILQDNPKVLFCSSFQHAIYPFPKENQCADNVRHIPLPAGCKGDTFQQAMAEQCLPAVDEFQPELILVSAGFDAHVEDELAQTMLTERDYQWITQELVRLAEKHANGRMVSMLEGGYAIPALGRAVASHIKAIT